MRVTSSDNRPPASEVERLISCVISCYSSIVFMRPKKPIHETHEVTAGREVDLFYQDFNKVAGVEAQRRPPIMWSRSRF